MAFFLVTEVIESPCGIRAFVVGNGIVFRIVLTYLGNVDIQLFSCQLWVNTRADWAL